MKVLQLVEYQDSPYDLADEDLAYLLAGFPGKISVRRALPGTGYILNPNQFVGVLSLPSGARLECRPKVPIKNVFHMLALALDLPSPFRDELARYDRFDDIFEFVVAFFASLMERRIALGLYRAYVDEEDNLPAVRGRIAFAEDVRRNAILRHRTYCRYSEFTWDIPKNQIIHQVIRQLSAWGFRSTLQRRLIQLESDLAEVSATQLPASVLDRFVYHRLNDDYQVLHRFCRLFLEGASLAHEEGAFEYQTFLIDMNRLFEAFVTRVLRDHAPHGARVRAQVSLHLAQGNRVPMRADVVIDHGGVPALVADCKYKQLEPEEYGHHDLYQLLAYCTATQVTHGVLIYPGQPGLTDDEFPVLHTPVVLHRALIDLSLKGDALAHECETFARKIHSRI